MRLNLGCGANIFPHPWLNLDKIDMESVYLRHLRAAEDVSTWTPAQQELKKYLDAGRITFFRHDLRTGFPMYLPGSIEAIYIGQVVEHLNVQNELPSLLQWCYLLLKPGGRVRITTPDLSQLLAAHYSASERGTNDLLDFADEQPEFYLRAMPDDQLAYIMYGASGARCTTENYEGHMHLFSWHTMAQRLMDAGFLVHKPGERHELFDLCRDEGMSHSFAIEGEKPCE